MESQARTLRGLTAGLGRTGLVAGTTSTYTTTITSAGSINGEYVTGITAQTNTATPTTDCVTGVAFTALQPDFGTVIVFGQTLAGVIQMCRGSSERLQGGITTTPGTFNTAPQFPQPPDDFMVLGYCTVRLGPSAGAFTAGTTSWTATGTTTSTFRNNDVLPDRPRIS